MTRYIKLEGPHGTGWLEVSLDSNEAISAFSQGLSLGWSLGRQEQMEVTDVRLSKPPIEPILTPEQIRRWTMLE